MRIHNLKILMPVALSLIMLAPSLIAPSAAQSNISYKIVAHFSLPAGYSISTGIAMPTYIPNVDTIYVFATRGGSSYLLALSGSTGALKASAVRFGGQLNRNFVYDQLNNRIFISQTFNIEVLSAYRIIAISTTTNNVVANFTAPDGAAAITYDSYKNQVYSASCVAGYCIAPFVDVFNAATGAYKGHIQILTGSGFVSSMIYDFKNHNVYVDYYVANPIYPYGLERIAVIPDTSLSVSTKMSAPDVNSSFYENGGYLAFDPTNNVLLDSQLPFGISAPVGGEDAFNTTTNTMIPSMSSGGGYGNDVAFYDAGRQTIWGNFAVVTYDAGGFDRAQPSSSEQSLNPLVVSHTIPAINPKNFEVCTQVLSSPSFAANFAQCQAWTPYPSAPTGQPHMDILSTANGALLGRIMDPSAIVNGHTVYYQLYAFGDNTAKNIEYAVGDGSGFIYSISA
jgi:hypothetical protein